MWGEGTTIKGLCSPREDLTLEGDSQVQFWGYNAVRESAIPTR